MISLDLSLIKKLVQNLGKSFNILQYTATSNKIEKKNTSYYNLKLFWFDFHMGQKRDLEELSLLKKGMDPNNDNFLCILSAILSKIRF